MAFEYNSGRASTTTTGDSEEAIDLRDLMGAIGAHKVFVAACGIALFAAVMGYTLLKPMVFKSTSRLYLGELDAPTSVADPALAGGDVSGVSTEIEILRSRSLVERAVVDAGMNVWLEAPGFEPLNYFEWRRSGRQVEALAGASSKVLPRRVALNGTATTSDFLIKFLDDSSYEVFADSESIGRGSLGARFEGGGLAMTLLPGATAVPRAGEQLELSVYPVEDVVDSAIDALEVSAPSSTSETVKVISLEFSDPSPYVAARFLRCLMQVYLEERQTWKTENATAAEQFVGQQLQSMRESLDANQEKLAEFRSENRAVVSDSESTAMVGQLGRYEEQRVAAKLEVSALSSILSAVRDPDAPVEAFMAGEATDAVLQSLAKSLSDSRQKLSELRSKFKSAAPDLKHQEASVAAQREMIKSYVRSRLSRARKKVVELDRVIETYEGKLKSLPTAELGLAQIGRESEVYNRMFSYLMERQQQTAIVRASTISKNRVLDRPRVPSWEDSPRLGLRAASLVVGLLLGCLVVVARTLVSAKVSTQQDIQRLASRAPLLAQIPATRNPPRRRPGARAAPAIFDLLANPVETFAFTEGFRTLRAAIYAQAPVDRGQVLTITSPSPGDGKTTCTLALAAILAGDRKKVLVIDADVRKPSHHTLTMAPANTGLRGVLEEMQGWRDVVHKVHLSVGTFDSLGCSMPARPELLGSPQLTKFLIDARSRYDYILLDTASFPLVADAVLLARQSDLILSVMRLGATNRRGAEAHLEGLSGGTPLAWVLNNAEPVSTYAYGYGYGYGAGESSAASNSSTHLANERLQ